MKRCCHGYDLWKVRHLLSPESCSLSLYVVAKEQPTWNPAARMWRIRSNCLQPVLFVLLTLTRKWILSTWKTLNFILCLFNDAFSNRTRWNLCGRKQAWSTVPTFAWSDWEKSRNVSEGPVCGRDFEPFDCNVVWQVLKAKLTLT
jgi:hypothetical protein